MSTVAQADLVARLLERLLADPGFRARFRRDPAGTCREAGLHELAEEMAPGGGKAMHTLDLRESRSSLAGLIMAAAMEGVAFYEMLDDPPPVVGEVLSRVDLSAVPGALRAETAQAAEGAPRAQRDTQARRDPPAQPVESRAPKATSAADGEERPPRRREEDRPAGQTKAAPVASAAASAEPVAAAGPARSYDPAQFGAEGTGGTPTPEALALLDNDRVILDDVGRADLRAGRIDPRVIAVLTHLSQEHEITVSCMCSDHSKLTTGGSISNHWHGRGLDIAAIDGQPVNATNPDARELATDLQDLPDTLRPSEIGTPWPINGPGYFTDPGHQDHLHLGYDQPLPTTWQPPHQLTATPPADHPPPPAHTPGQSLQLPAAPHATTATTDDRPSTFTHLPTPHDPPRPDKASATTTPGDSANATPAAGQGAAAAESAEGGGGARPAGSRALAALAEAKRHLGTPYRWGGSRPQDGFDCSGLVQWAYAKAGIRIPRVTFDQVEAPGGERVERADLRPGDLVFFQDPAGSVYHVGMSLGGDRFIHAPRTGDVVKEASLDTPYFGQRFAGGRRFDEAPATDAPVKASAPDPDPGAVADAEAGVARDAAEAGREDSALFFAIAEQEATNHRESLALLPAVQAPGRAAAAVPAVPGAGDPPPPDLAGVPTDYPGDAASPQERARWLAAQAERHGLPPELPVMAALVESGMRNLDGGHADSVGFFQMRVGIWNTGAYAGYPDRPELQMRWFIDQALAVKRRRLAQGLPVDDPRHFGEWIADVERPAEQYRGRYQLRLNEARRLLGR